MIILNQNLYQDQQHQNRVLLDTEGKALQLCMPL